MAIIFNQSKSDGIWCDYPGDKDIKIKIRPATKDILRKLSRKATVTEQAREAGRMVTREVVDDEKFDQLIAHHMIEDWQGFIGPDETPVPCTDQNKEAAMARYLQIANWISDQAFTLAEKADKKKQND